MTRTLKAAEAKRLARDLASLPRLSREELLARWRVLYGTAPPSHISRPILIRAIAYRMQERVLGGLKPATRKLLQRVAEEARAGGPVTAAPIRVLKPGTRLLREWQGVTHEVIVLEDGVLFRGKRYRSLSEVARVITGSRWSGPRFFGLRAPTTEPRGDES
jgi:hypothetical protein